MKANNPAIIVHYVLVLVREYAPVRPSVRPQQEEPLEGRVSSEPRLTHSLFPPGLPEPWVEFSEAISAATVEGGGWREEEEEGCGELRFFCISRKFLDRIVFDDGRTVTTTSRDGHRASTREVEKSTPYWLRRRSATTGALPGPRRVRHLDSKAVEVHITY